MNAAIRAVLLTARHYKLELVGFYHGYNGLVNNESAVLTLDDIDGIIHRGGTILKSARCQEMHSQTGIKKAAQVLKQESIEALIVIGGDGSFAGLIELNKVWHGHWHPWHNR